MPTWRYDALVILVVLVPVVMGVGPEMDKARRAPFDYRPPARTQEKSPNGLEEAAAPVRREVPSYSRPEMECRDRGHRAFRVRRASSVRV